jgi:hypothetical protein
VKYKDIETGDVRIWGGTNTTSRFFQILSEKRTFGKEFIEQRNLVVSRLLDELQGDSIQTFELVSAYYRFVLEESKKATVAAKRPPRRTTGGLVKDVKGILLKASSSSSWPQTNSFVCD